MNNLTAATVIAYKVPEGKRYIARMGLNRMALNRMA